MKKYYDIFKKILLLSFFAAVISFLFERIEEIKYFKIKYIHKPYGIYEHFIKRPMDVFLTTIALIVLSPIILLLVILVKVKLGNPVFFTQERPGRINPLTGEPKIFKLYKFRTMTDECDKDGKLLSDEKRLTSFGKKLRSTSLDELPELFNILKGDMSIIGPRPLLVRYLPAYKEYEKKRHDVRPGLSGLAQINGRNYLSWDDRLLYDVKYVKKITFLEDIRIIFVTIINVLQHKDVAINTEDID